MNLLQAEALKAGANLPEIPGVPPPGAQSRPWPASEDKLLPKAQLGSWKEGAVPCPTTR